MDPSCQGHPAISVGSRDQRPGPLSVWVAWRCCHGGGGAAGRVSRGPLPLSDEPRAHWGPYPSGLRATHPFDLHPRAPLCLSCFCVGPLSWGPHTALMWPGSLPLGGPWPPVDRERGRSPSCRAGRGCHSPLVPDGPPGETAQSSGLSIVVSAFGVQSGPRSSNPPASLQGPEHLPVLFLRREKTASKDPLGGTGGCFPHGFIMFPLEQTVAQCRENLAFFPGSNPCTRPSAVTR